uniref:DDE Tnp4 domain-containing protein n=1 Tax=Gadus morhua TaxID=8049 RepID=A0A8C5A4H2_GADMO
HMAVNQLPNAMFDESLEAERTRTRAAEKKQKSLELIQDATDKSRLLTRQRRRRIRVRKNRASTCWESYLVGIHQHSGWITSGCQKKHSCNSATRCVQRCRGRTQTFALKKIVAIALWKLATNAEYRSIGHLFGVSRTTVCRCLQQFCNADCKVLAPEMICFPDQEKLKEMAAYIEQKWGLPQCVGSIDGSHIPIIAPQECDVDYFNRKGWHSIILQGVVDGKGQFWSVCAGMPGCMHDARVLRTSTMWELVERGRLFPACARNITGVNVGHYIRGDSAYPAEQLLYNKRVCRARVVLENAFGRLKGRWRCLLKRNDSSIELAKTMIVACYALDNLCEKHAEDYQTELDIPAALAAEPMVPLAQGAEEEGREVRCPFHTEDQRRPAFFKTPK